MGEIAVKFRDAASMFWEALDTRERTLVLYAGAYLLVNIYLAVTAREKARSRERLKAELLEEITRG